MKTQDLYRMAGADNLDDVIKNWEAERQGMRELHDNNAALAIYNRRIRLIIILCIKAFDILESQGTLFLPEKAANVIIQVRDQIKKADKIITASREICDQIISKG